ncbi:MAG: flagellar export chaperone FlgN [Candidatus Tectimicrobiota bacterium]
MSTSVQLLAVVDRLLQQEVDAYETLLRLHQDGHGHLTAPALEPLLANLQAREHLARHLRQLEQQRAEALRQLAPVLPLLPMPPTLAALSAQVEEPYRGRFLQHRARLRQLMEALQESNTTQTQLLTEARAFVDAALAFLARFLPAQTTYKPSGQLTTPTQGRLLSGSV